MKSCLFFHYDLFYHGLIPSSSLDQSLAFSIFSKVQSEMYRLPGQKIGCTECSFSDYLSAFDGQNHSDLQIICNQGVADLNPDPRVLVESGSDFWNKFGSGPVFEGRIRIIKSSKKARDLHI